VFGFGSVYEAFGRHGVFGGVSFDGACNGVWFWVCVLGLLYLGRNGWKRFWR
jgi:hypothetical protein